MIAPAPDMPETNSTSSSSTTVAGTVPRPAMAWEISLISSSSSACPDRGVLLAEGEQDHGRLLGAGQASGVVDAWLLGGRRAAISRLMQPAAEDRDRLLGMLLDELGDLLDRGRLHLALDAGDVDALVHLGLGAGQGAASAAAPPAGRLHRWPAPPPTATGCSRRRRPPAAARRRAVFSSGRTTKKISSRPATSQDQPARRRA